MRSSFRRAAVIGGHGAWPWETVRRVLDDTAAAQTILISPQAVPGFSTVDPSRAKSLLGGEFDAVVFDARAALDADALGAVSGTVRGGGVLLVVVPSVAQIESGPSHFLRRFVRSARSAAGVACLFEGESTSEVYRPFSAPTSIDREAGGETPDQRRAIDAVTHVVLGHRRRPAVLLADRGRGKSAALGIAAAELLKSGKSCIIVTAPRPPVADVIFRHLRQSLGLHYGSSEGFVARAGVGECRFIPPDELLRHPVDADLILVDEAAGIPVAVLAALLRRYPRIAFATTVHGYEGSGRGFVLHFTRVLDQVAPGWRMETLTAPIRWAANDPVERWINDALLLDADYAQIDERQQPTSVRRCDRAELAQRDEQLKPLVGLLVQAHYRTTPDDLRQMLDDERIETWAARDSAGSIVGAVLAAREGPLDADVALAIQNGRRRIQGGLLPQSLLFHCGMSDAAGLSFKRVVRITVHPQRRRQGIGRDMLAHFVRQATVEGVDVIGASFAADDSSISFWHAWGGVPARLGITPDHASGLRSLIVLRGVSGAGEKFVAAASERFVESFVHGLPDQWRDVEPSLVLALLAARNDHAAPLDAGAIARLRGYGQAQAHFDACALDLWKLCRARLSSAAAGSLSAPQAAALVRKVLQKHPWSDMAGLLDVSGKSEAERLVREAVKALL